MEPPRADINLQSDKRPCIDAAVIMSLSEEELLFNNDPYLRMYGSVDDSNIASSDTFISSGSFEVRYGAQ